MIPKWCVRDTPHLVVSRKHTGNFCPGCGLGFAIELFDLRQCLVFVVGGFFVEPGEGAPVLTEYSVLLTPQRLTRFTLRGRIGYDASPQTPN